MHTLKGNCRRRVRDLTLLLLLVVGCVLPTGCQPGLRRGGSAGGFPSRDSIRAIWVTRWDYKSPADIARIMENCRQTGFNTVLFQVRGHGTACYRSRLEPWRRNWEDVIRALTRWRWHAARRTGADSDFMPG